MLLELIADYLRKDKELAKIADVVSSRLVRSLDIHPHDGEHNNTVRIGIVANKSNSDIPIGYIIIHVVGGSHRIAINPADPKFTSQDILHIVNRIIPIDPGRSANKRNLYTEYGFQYLIGTYI